MKTAAIVDKTLRIYVCMQGIVSIFFASKTSDCAKNLVRLIFIAVAAHENFYTEKIS